MSQRPSPINRTGAQGARVEPLPLKDLRVPKRRAAHTP